MTDPTGPADRRPSTVDAHHHVWDLAVRDQEWTDGLPLLHRTYLLDDLRPALAEAGIARTVVVQTVADRSETAELLALAEGGGRDVIAGVVGWTDLTAPDVDARVAALQDLPGARRLVGLRHLVQGEDDPQWLCRADVRRGLGAVGAAGLAYDLLVLPHQIPAAIATVRALPGVRFVLDHLAKPPIRTGALEPWRSDVVALAQLSNVAVKLSGMVTEADPDSWSVDDLRRYADTVLEAFGPARTMYGSDWPVCLLGGTYRVVHDAARQLTGTLSTAEQAAVFGGTAGLWYRLQP